MLRQQVADKVIKIIANKMNLVDDGTITEDSNLKDDCDVDSLDKVEVIMEVERDFCVSVSTKDFNGIETVKDIVDYLVASEVATI